MKTQVKMLQDQLAPDRYILVLDHPDDPDYWELLLWRDARKLFGSEAFVKMARTSFADWCERRGL